MKALRERLCLDRNRDAGMTLIEVMVALFILAIISTGVLYSMLSAIQVTRDSRTRHVAANLAAQEIDLARASADLFTLADATKNVTLNGDAFTVVIDTNWVSDPAVDKPCGAGGGAIRYKRVNVAVTWGGMRAGSEAVRADTVIDPNNRINDPAKGTILVSVLKPSGQGADNITVTATPTSGGAPLTVVPKPTDSEGCTYILQVVPGEYSVKITRSNYRTEKQEPSPVTQTAVVTAGGAASVGFQFDRESTFEAKLAANGPAVTYLPTALDVSWRTGYGTHRTLHAKLPTNSSKMTGQQKLHPFIEGYEVMAGPFAPKTQDDDGCISVDPGSWPTQAVAGGELTGTSPEAVAAAPGATAPTIDVPMGLVTVGGVVGGRYLKAVSTSTPAGADPGCSDGMTYTFGEVLPTSGTITVALPYGTWQFFSGSLSTQATPVPITALAVAAPSTVNLVPANSVTLDPRVLVP